MTLWGTTIDEILPAIFQDKSLG